TVNAEPVSPAIMKAVIGVRNPVPVVAAALPPVAVLGLPVARAMLLPRAVLFLLPLTLSLRRTLDLGGSLPIALLAAPLLRDALLLRPHVVRWPLLSALRLLAPLLLRPGIVRGPLLRALRLLAPL